MKLFGACVALATGLLATAAPAAEISTHVLDLARGVGGAEIPVTLQMKQGNGQWTEVAKATTNENGRVKAFDEKGTFQTGLYKLSFDLSAYPDSRGAPFFPEIDVVFRVEDGAGHYHVPVVVSPYGYSTYRGN